MLQLVNTHKKEKKKYSICKESNKFANPFDLKLKEIGIKDKSTEAAKTYKEELYEQKTESIDLFESSYPIFTSIKYKESNDAIGCYIHWKVC